jgi:hypothetical protein
MEGSRHVLDTGEGEPQGGRGATAAQDVPAGTTVLIAGGGPIGSAPAVERALRGVDCAVVERRPSPRRARLRSSANPDPEQVGAVPTAANMIWDPVWTSICPLRARRRRRRRRPGGARPAPRRARRRGGGPRGVDVRHPGADRGDVRPHASAIVVDDGVDAIAWEQTEYRPQSKPGHRLPHAWLPDGAGSLYRRLGDDFTLLNFAADPERAGAVSAGAQAAGVPLVVVHLSSDALRDAYAADLVLVRPDLHVAWRGDDMPVEVDLWAVVRGAATVRDSAARRHLRPAA